MDLASTALVHSCKYVVTLALLLLAACSSEEPTDLPASFVRLSIDKSDPERLAAYYFGGYVSPSPADPFEQGIIHKQGGALYLNVDSLERHYPGAISLLTDSDRSGRIEWEELEQFVDATYYEARSAPATLASLRREIDFDSTSADWMHVEVDGVMTTARRHVYVPKSAIIDALSKYWENDQHILYPVGTAIVGEHYLDGRRVESTVMQKREDGYWDFFVYGANDTLAPATATPPKELKSPVQCVGCHFGRKLFEPEKSFPIAARPGPHGPRQVYVGDSLRTENIVRFFDEHRKRSDTILGLYSTLFVAELQSMKRKGTLPENYAALLDRLQL